MQQLGLIIACLRQLTGLICDGVLRPLWSSLTVLHPIGCKIFKSRGCAIDRMRQSLRNSDSKKQCVYVETAQMNDIHRCYPLQ